MGTAYLFPGQGSQQVGMGQSLAAAHAVARAVYAAADEILGFPLSDLCFQGPEEALTDTVNQQPALLATSVAAWEVLGQSGDWPAADFVAGHSLGEFSALVAAGAMSFADALRLVRRRGELMADAGAGAPGGMAAVLGLDAAPLAALCAQAAAETDRPVQLANDNCPGQLVISGDQAALARAMELAAAAGSRRIVALPITIAAHSPLMASAAAAFATAVDQTPIAAPRVPVIGNVSAGPLTTADAIRAELKAQLTAAVRWTESMQYLLTQGVTLFSEVGPGDVLTKLMRRINRDAERRPFSV